MGSGHILVYAFDVLMQIYESCGYTHQDAAKSIVENNLYGIDIDRRAYQLAYFAVMMKARSYNRRAFRDIKRCNLCAIVDTNNFSENHLELFGGLKDTAKALADEFIDAKEYGSILNIQTSIEDIEKLIAKYNEIKESVYDNMFDTESQNKIITEFEPVLRQAKALAQKYDSVVTNPPYMSPTPKQKPYVEKCFTDSKADLFAVFIEKCQSMTKDNCYYAMITMHSWMFLSSFEKLRSKLMNRDTINMAHLGPRAFDSISGEVVQTTSFIRRMTNISHYNGTYLRLTEPKSEMEKQNMFLSGENRFYARQSNFSLIPGNTIAYWISDKYTKVFLNNKISEFGDSCIGMRTGDNERFLRFWYEISLNKFGTGFSSSNEAQKSKKKWFPYCKGGSFRKWYGNNDYLVNWEDDGFEIKENTRRVYPYLGDNLGWKISNENRYFQPGLTWSGVGARIFGVRAYPQGMIFDSGANSFFVNDHNYYYYMAGLLNCKIINDIIGIINPTINTGCGVIAQLPAVLSQNNVEVVSKLVKDSIETSKYDWDSFETSWDFKKNPLI